MFSSSKLLRIIYSRSVCEVNYGTHNLCYFKEHLLSGKTDHSLNEVIELDISGKYLSSGTNSDFCALGIIAIIDILLTLLIYK